LQFLAVTPKNKDEEKNETNSESPSAPRKEAQTQTTTTTTQEDDDAEDEAVSRRTEWRRRRGCSSSEEVGFIGFSSSLFSSSRSADLPRNRQKIRVPVADRQSMSWKSFFFR
jgi:hypothetical protein